MIIELLGISAPRAKRRELGEALASLVGPVQVQRGCLDCRLFQSWPLRNEFQLETRWASQEDLNCHLRSDAYKKLLLLMELSAAPPVVEFLSVVESHGLDLVKMARNPSD